MLITILYFLCCETVESQLGLVGMGLHSR